MPDYLPGNSPSNEPINAVGLMGSRANKYYILAAAVLGLDQLTKVYFMHKLALYDSVAVIDPVLDFTLAYNKGAAFSFLANQSGWQKWFFVVLGLVVAGFIVRYLRAIDRRATVLALGLAGVLGGALGNVLDRVLYGHVIDFIHVHWDDAWHYPIFNVADIGICLGVFLIVWDMLFLEKPRVQASNADG